MSEAEIVWGESPSALAVSEKFANLSPADRRQAEARALVGKDEERIKTPYYRAAAFSPPEVLRLLDYAHAKNGQPLQPPALKFPRLPVDASAEALLAYANKREVLLAQVTEETEGFMARFRFWAGCDAQTKSQLAADAAFNLREPNSPAWSVSIAQDPICPNLVIRAESATLARIRYSEL
jgi:hypothetical protein